jgi:hypothetical protein
VSELPGLDPRRLVALMRAAVERVDLDLDGRTVVTEAATGAYSVTPVLAALAGARRVHALARDSRYGTSAEVAARTESLAAEAGVGVDVVTSKGDAALADADIVTNSGHLRPLDGATIRRMKPGAAIPLMYEAWELRAGDVDLEACRRRGIRVGGTNERHPAVDVFSFLGVMAVKLLTDAGVSVYASRLLLLCDNPFQQFIARGLVNAGAEVEVRERLGGETIAEHELAVAAATPVRPRPDDGPVRDGLDAVVVALRPRSEPVLNGVDAGLLADRAPGAVVAQRWGDLDRSVLRAAGVPVWPPAAPPPGHMGILPSAVGPEPVVRLQAAGLKVGEVLCRGPAQRRPSDLEYVQPL